MELDHFFILTEAPAKQADHIHSIGLIEGTANDHPGQGTSNRRFFCANTTLEFLYVRDEVEAATGPAKALNFHGRSTNTTASPFGLVLKSTDWETCSDFPGWKYYPDYFSNDMCFHVGNNSDILEEPLCIGMPKDLPRPKNKPVPENSDLILTELKVGVPVSTPSNSLAAISKIPLITVQPNQPHCLELTFNDGTLGLRKEFSPGIPLIVNW